MAKTFFWQCRWFPFEIVEMTNLKDIIVEQLSSLVGKKCVVPDLPYYSNVGDLLIWEGMERFLNDNGTEILWRSSISTFEYKPLPEDVTICLVGGGNFGDLWRGLQEFKCEIVKLYPKNRIVIFPQSVCYKDSQLCKDDADVFATHGDVHICVRDKKSFDFLKENFPTCNNILVPDMALYLDFDKQHAKTNRILFLKRDDKESVDYSDFNTEGMEVTDWPMHHSDNHLRWSLSDKIRHKLIRIHIDKDGSVKAINLLKYKFSGKALPHGNYISEKWKKIDDELAYLSYLNNYKFPKKLDVVIDWFVYNIYQPLTIQYGVDFINRYDVIYATRLHAAILGYLLGKEVHVIDNSYGKISSLFDTWNIK